jgi:Hpt domain
MAADANPESCQHVGAEEAPPQEAPVDLSHLRRYTLGDRRLEMEILGLFIEQAPLTVAALQRAGSDRDWVNAAHTLKGSARAVGAWSLAKLAERAERLGGICDRTACERMLHRIEQATAQARAQIVLLGESD